MRVPKFFTNNFIVSFLVAIIAGIFICSPASAQPVEISPHIFVDEVDEKDWFLNGNSNFIFAGCGSPLFPNKKTHYLDYKTIKYGTLPDGRFIITCFF